MTPILRISVFDILILSQEVPQTAIDSIIVPKRAVSSIRCHRGRRHIYMSVHTLFCFRRNHSNVKTTRMSFAGHALRSHGNAGTTTINVNQPTALHALFGSQTVKTRKMDFNQKEVSLLCIWFVRTTELLKQGPVREMIHGRHKHTLITENVNICLLFQMNIIQMVICHHARG